MATFKTVDEILASKLGLTNVMVSSGREIPNVILK